MVTELVAMVTLLFCYYGNHANGVQSDTHIHHHCQETHNNISITCIVVAMATILADYT